MTAQKILQMDDSQYQRFLFKKYLDWCIVQSHNQIDLQMQLANKAMYNFFKYQIQGLEQDFIEEATPYVNKVDNKEAMIKLWHRNVQKIFMLRNERIRNKARKVNITNTITKHDLESI